MAFAVEVLERFDEFLFGFFESFDPSNTLLMIVSDHGNIENLSTKSHTRNRVPRITVGKQRHQLENRIKNLYTYYTCNCQIISRFVSVLCSSAVQHCG